MQISSCYLVLFKHPGLIYGTEPALELIEFFVRAVTETRNQWNCHEGVMSTSCVDVGVHVYVHVHACVHIRECPCPCACLFPCPCPCQYQCQRPCYMSLSMPNVHVHAHAACVAACHVHDRRSCPCYVFMSLLPVHCMSLQPVRCISMLHAHDACPRCLSIMHVHFACPFCMRMMHVQFACPWSMHAPCPCIHSECSSALLVYAACSSSMSMLHVHECCLNMNMNSIKRLYFLSHFYRYLRQRYIIIPHVQAPLQIDAGTKKLFKNSRFFYICPASSTSATDFPQLLKSTKRSSVMPIR